MDLDACIKNMYPVLKYCHSSIQQFLFKNFMVKKLSLAYHIIAFSYCICIELLSL